MSQRCRHRKNVTIYEETITELGWQFFEGGLVSDFARDARPTGVVVAKCDDCGKVVRDCNGTSLPMWAWSLWNSIRKEMTP